MSDSDFNVWLRTYYLTLVVMSDSEHTVWHCMTWSSRPKIFSINADDQLGLSDWHSLTPWTIAIWGYLPPQVAEMFDQLDQQQRDDWAAWPGAWDNWASWSTKNRPDLVLTRKPNTATSKAKFLVGFKNFSFINPCFFISLPWQPRQQQSMLDMSFLRTRFERILRITKTHFHHSST